MWFGIAAYGGSKVDPATFVALQGDASEAARGAAVGPRGGVLMDVPDSQPIYRYWVDVTDRRDGSVRTLPLGAVQRIHLVAGKGEAPRPTEQVLQLKDPAGVLEAKNLDELVAKLRERYPDATHERFLRREHDPEAEQRRAAAMDGLIDLMVDAVLRDLHGSKTETSSGDVGGRRGST
jgi:hypothetical protein